MHAFWGGALIPAFEPGLWKAWRRFLPFRLLRVEQIPLSRYFCVRLTPPWVPSSLAARVWIHRSTASSFFISPSFLLLRLRLGF